MSTIANLLIKIGVDADEAQRQLSGFGSKARSGLNKAFLPALAVLGAAGVAAKGASAEAVNLGEAQNAVSVVFGKSAGVINAFAKGAARSAGLSMLQASQAAVPLGASLQNFGFSTQDAAKNTVVLTKRAADMASVFNTSVPEALEAIQAGLRGEADPLEKFGVGLSDAAVRAKAVEMGLAKTTSGVSEHGKMQARVALLLQQTNKYQGDFARTSGSAANAARINAAEAANLQASYGKGLIPVLSLYQSVVGGLLGFMGRHQTATKVLIGVIVGLAAVVVVANVALKLQAAGVLAVAAAKGIATGATKVWTAAQWLLNAALRANPLGIVITLVAALVAGIVIAYQRSNTFRGIVQAAFNAVKVAVDAVRAAVMAVVGAITAAANSPVVKTLVSIYTAQFRLIVAAVRSVDNAVDLVVGAVRSAANSPAISAVRQAFGNAWSAIKSVINSAADAVSNVIAKVQSAIGWVNDLSSKVSSVVGKAGGLARKVLPGLANGGIVTRATTALIGEAGPEVVIPLTRPRRAQELMDATGLSGKAGGGGPTVNIGTMVVQDATDVERVAARLGRKLAMA